MTVFPAPTAAPSWADIENPPAPSNMLHASRLLFLDGTQASYIRRYAWVHHGDTIVISTRTDLSAVAHDLTPAVIVRMANELLTDEERALIRRPVEAVAS